jgi:subtilisin family serine protease
MTGKTFPAILLAFFLLLGLYVRTEAGDRSKTVTVNNGKQDARPVYERLMEQAESKGYAKVIMELEVKNLRRLTENSTRYKNSAPGSRFPAAGIEADLALERAIHRSADLVMYRLNGMDYRLNHKYGTVPFLALDVSPETLALLETVPEVLAIHEDRLTRLEEPVPGRTVEKDVPLLSTSTQLIGADNAWSSGYTGNGWYVAILDTGILRSHQFFSGKRIIEACYSAEGHCPNGNTFMTGKGAAAHYSNTYSGFDHGTHVKSLEKTQLGLIELQVLPFRCGRLRGFTLRHEPRLGPGGRVGIYLYFTFQLQHCRSQYEFGRGQFHRLL